MDSQNILQLVVIAISTWTLKEVVAQGKTIAALKQKLRDLPCGDCAPQPNHQ